MSNRYLSSVRLAELIGVTRAAISTWRRRHDDFPLPDVWVGDAPGWDPARLQEIRDWRNERHPPTPNEVFRAASLANQKAADRAINACAAFAEAVTRAAP
jgi:hypothetical protein